MNILITIGDLNIARGAERVAVNLANAFSEQGHKVELLSFFKGDLNSPFEISPSVKLSYINLFSEENQKKDKNFLYRFYIKNFYKIFLSYKIKTMYPEVDFIISNSSNYFPYFKNKNTRYIAIQHMLATQGSKRNKLYDALVILSSKELKIWQNFYKCVVVIPNFIPHIPNLNTNLKQKQVIAVGKLSKEKGFNRLIEIWNLLAQDENFKQEFRQWKLIIVGDGKLKEDLEKQIRDLNLEKNIILKPFTKEVEKEYLNASIYTLSSHFESFGMVLAEASSFALPCIAFDVKTGPSDIIENEKTGFLVQDDDLQDFAQKLKLLMKDESLREKFGKNAKEKIKKEFSKEVVLKKWEELFKNLKA
ncbi:MULTISPECIES: glycosyltransferase family 4 protein [unclassified Campylobacter]|uniref:glycosyltransferase family 4 protein n=1 Tax=unclassified Campylobacter TaxID=2593542 RepID=UPI00192ECB1B|nr:MULTISPECIES: glycosyltransferase family 4 protein [unclassified Campylobacter]